MRAVALGLPLALLAGCPASDSTYAVSATGHARATTGGVATAAAASATAGASGSGTGGSTSGASTGTTGTSGAPFICPATLDACDAGVELITQAVNALGSGSHLNPISGTIQLTDVVLQTLAVTSGPDAILLACLPAGTLINPELAAPGYVTSIYNEFDLVSSECLPYVALLPSAGWQLITSSLQDYDVSQGTLLTSAVNAAYGGVCSQSGWVFSLFDPDGGPVAATVAYISGIGVSPNATATAASGTAVLYNIDPAVSVVRVVGTHIDGGAPATPCGQIQGQAEYTGFVHLAPNVVSTFSYPIADAG